MPSKRRSRSVRPAKTANDSRDFLESLALNLRRINAHLSAHPTEAPTVMIVDDDDDARDILATVLEHAGYATVRVANGKDALRKLSKVIPALILCDLRMPEMDGWTLDRRLRADPVLRRIPVVVVSALANLQAARVGIHARAWFQKPVHLGQLIELLSKLTDRREPDPISTATG